MKQPTQAQIKVLWKWCGLKEGTCGWLYDPDNRPDLPIFPSIDLNNLFKYAVPKAIDIIMAEQECSSNVAYAILFKKWEQELELDIPNHEGTLFWVLDKVREVSND